MYTKRGGVAAYRIVWIGLCLRSVPGVRVLASVVDDLLLSRNGSPTLLSNIRFDCYLFSFIWRGFRIQILVQRLPVFTEVCVFPLSILEKCTNSSPAKNCFTPSTSSPFILSFMAIIIGAVSTYFKLKKNILQKT